MGEMSFTGADEKGDTVVLGFKLTEVVTEAQEWADTTGDRVTLLEEERVVCHVWPHLLNLKPKARRQVGGVR